MENYRLKFKNKLKKQQIKNPVESAEIRVLSFFGFYILICHFAF